MNLDIVMVTIDCASPRTLAEFWTQALDASVAYESDEFVMLAANREGGVRVALQRVPEPRAGKNRAHLDLDTTDRKAEVRRLVELGATELAENSMQGFTWTVLADPEGNEFCVGSEH
ncbi:VOC family protein [Saccharopolyspora indica]|uniref:VOC family protein n=1 Tax=Saccharopolyspora indica TaxID=1229659 RepID=UPI0022EAC6A3|nr:VOC family protein [Saccharopolyspora indica]MDA3643607.1 VOC family protein [Saccharopolyspora indica]